MRVAVIGGGMSGVAAGIKLAELGIEYTIYEKGDSVGGTWRENTYPGLSCDVPSLVYCYSFAPSAEWMRQYASQPEIHAYFKGVAERYGVLAHIRFNDEVTSCRWTGGRWHVDTAHGHHDEVDLVIAATGVLHHPNIAHFEGEETFRGAMFHSARWDHSVALDGKRIGIVGTGSTAVQLVSALVDRVEHLDLFQRSAQWVMTEPNPEVTEEQREKLRREPARLDYLHREIGDRFRNFLTPGLLDPSSEAYAAVRARAEESLATVRDPVLRKKLTPDHLPGCKRFVISPDFYEKIQRPNAELVTSGIERIEPTGVRTADGVLHEVDVLVLATGFRVDRYIRPVKVVGPGGVDLDDVWADGPFAYLSMAVPGFPNLFFLNGPNGPVGNFSLIETAERQLRYLLQLVEPIRMGERHEVEVRDDATKAFEEERIAAAAGTVWVSGCKSWYLDKRGVPITWTFTYERFLQEMDKPDLSAYEMR